MHPGTRLAGRPTAASMLPAWRGRRGRSRHALLGAPRQQRDPSRAVEAGPRARRPAGSSTTSAPTARRPTTSPGSTPSWSPSSPRRTTPGRRRSASVPRAADPRALPRTSRRAPVRRSRAGRAGESGRLDREPLRDRSPPPAPLRRAGARGPRRRRRAVRLGARVRRRRGAVRRPQPGQGRRPDPAPGVRHRPLGGGAPAAGGAAACTVYTSGEHCPMCSAAHAWVGLGRIVYAVSAPSSAAG